MTETGTAHARPDTTDDTPSTGPQRRGQGHGWDRIGAPFAHALQGSPLRWGTVMLAGAALATAVLATGPMTGAAESGRFTTLAWACLLAVLPLLVAVDAALHMLPNRILYPTGALCAALLALDWATGGLPAASLLRALGVAAAMFLVSFAIVLAAPVGGYGMGDVRLLTLAGLVVGTHSWTLPLYTLLVVPPLLAIVPALCAAAAARSTKVGVAFGPYIALGITAAAFAQPVLAGLTG